MCFLFKLQLQNPVLIPPSLTAPPYNESEAHRVFFWSQVLVQSSTSIVAYDSTSYAVLHMKLIWKCKLVTRVSAPLLRAVPHHEHIWPGLQRLC